jgi:hypothetical protein
VYQTGHRRGGNLEESLNGFNTRSKERNHYKVRLNSYRHRKPRANAKKAEPAIATIPAAKPSKPSIKLTALIVTRTIKTVSSWPTLGGNIVTPFIGSHKI